MPHNAVACCPDAHWPSPNMPKESPSLTPAEVQDARKRLPPGWLQRGWNLASSLAAFTADACKTVSKVEYEARLNICDACPERQGNKCLKCGCRLSLKAQGRAFQCPLGRWPVLTAAPEATSPEEPPIKTT